MARPEGPAAGRRSLAELASLFEDNRDMHGETLGLSAATQAEIAATARAAFASLGGDALDRESATLVAAGRLSAETRQAWCAAAGTLITSPVVRVHRSRVGRRVRFCLYASTPEHDFGVIAGGTLVDTKVRSVEFFGEHWVYEHNLIVETEAPHQVRFADRSGRIRVDDHLTDPGPAPGPAAPANPPLGLRKLKRLVAPDWWQNRKSQLAARLARRGLGRRTFAHAWALADRRHQADDNAEALFRYVREHRPEINAWFAVGSRVPAYRDLRRQGAPVVAYGSIRHYLLLAHADVFASSQSDPGSRNPFGSFLPETWLFIYLKHGVIHTDHHRRFNPMRIDLLLAATVAEREGLVADPGPYRLAESEVALTGMPRLDRLQARLNERRALGRLPDVLLIAPTWRIYLATPNLNHVWTLTDGARDSDYVRNWSALIRDERLRELCAQEGLQPVFLMHPRFQHFSDLLPFPSWMTVASYHDDVSTLFARTRLTVTDYSSIAFETAYAGAPTVYFQFDRETFYSGGHSSQQGDYRFETHGFGPVTQDPDAAFKAIAAMLDGIDPQVGTYRARVDALYDTRDGSNSARAVAAIERLVRDAGSPGSAR